jgi:hypothetical protein
MTPRGLCRWPQAVVCLSCRMESNKESLRSSRSSIDSNWGTGQPLTRLVPASRAVCVHGPLLSQHPLTSTTLDAHQISHAAQITVQTVDVTNRDLFGN